MNAQRSLWSDETSPRGGARESAVIHWSCRRASHRAAPSRGGRGGLSVYQGRWAYCDGRTDDPDHDWVPTGGVPIGSLVDWARALEPARARTVRP